MIILIDDGTLDTVFRCTDCGEEERWAGPDAEYDGTRAEWVEEAHAETEATHECGARDW